MSSTAWVMTTFGMSTPSETNNDQGRADTTTPRASRSSGRRLLDTPPGCGWGPKTCATRSLYARAGRGTGHGPGRGECGARGSSGEPRRDRGRADHLAKTLQALRRDKRRLLLMASGRRKGLNVDEEHAAGRH